MNQKDREISSNIFLCQEQNMILRRFILTFCSITFISALVFAADLESKFDKARQLLNEGARTYSVEKLNAAKILFLELSNDDPGNYVYPYYMGLMYLELCNIKNFEIDKSAIRAEKKVRKAERVAIAGEGETYVNKSISLKEDFSDSHRLKGALISYKISGMISGMRFGGQADDEIKLSLKLDPNNSLASIETARKLIYNPAIAGGDLNEGIRLLKEVTKSNPELERAYILLGMAYEWKREYDKAMITFKDLLKINPANPEAQFFLDKILDSEK